MKTNWRVATSCDWKWYYPSRHDL